MNLEVRAHEDLAMQQFGIRTGCLNREVGKDVNMRLPKRVLRSWE
jgi:hypothetical protein